MFYACFCSGFRGVGRGPILRRSLMHITEYIEICVRLFVPRVVGKIKEEIYYTRAITPNRASSGVVHQNRTEFISLPISADKLDIQRQFVPMQILAATAKQSRRDQ